MIRFFQGFQNLRKADRRLLVRMMIPYLGITIVVLTSGLIAHWIALDVITEETIRINTSRINWSAEVLASRLDEIHGLVDQLGVDKHVQQFQKIDEPFLGANTYQVVVTIRDLAEHRLWNTSIINYFLLFHRSRYVLSPGVAYGYSDFAQQVLFLDEDDSQSWLDDISSNHHFSSVLPTQSISLLEGVRRAALFVRSLGSPGFSMVTAVVAIDARMLENILDRARDGDDGWAYLLDNSGSMISYRSSDGLPPLITSMEQSSSLEIRGSDRVFVTKAVVPRYGWEIVAGQPYDRVMAKVTRVRNIVVGLSAFLAVLGIVAAVLFAYRTAMPMGLLIGLFGAAKNTKAESISNSYDYINENIRRLIHDRDELREVVADQEPIVRTAFAEQLLSGRIRNREECAVIADRLGIAGSNLIMLPAAIALADRSRLLTERSLHELVELKTVLRRGLSASFSDEHLMFDTDETSMALVLWFDKTEKARIRERIEPMISIVATAISAHQAAEISFVFGPVCTDPFALSDSYTRAATLLLTHSSNQVILWAEDHPPAERSMYYPARIELQLKNAIQIGEGDAAEVIVRELLVENSDVRHLDPVILRILWSSVIGTIVRALDEIGYNNEAVLSWIDDSVNGKGMGSLSIGMPDIVQLVQISCAGTRNRVSDPGTKIIKQALTEIDLHLSDQNLSLQSVASALSLSEVHLSRLFSARIGRTFRDYVEEVRMARAKSLLLSTNYSIKEIAFSLGYQSLNSFSRAFHRRNGCTASSFRS